MFNSVKFCLFIFNYVLNSAYLCLILFRNFVYYDGLCHVTPLMQVFVGDMFSMVGAQSYSRSIPKSVTFMSVNESSNSYDLEVNLQ